MSEYPEHDKLQAVKDQSETIGQFLEWLTSGQGIMIAHWHTMDEPDEYGNDEMLLPHRESIENMLARYFKIDLKKIEDEKRQMLEKMREINA